MKAEQLVSAYDGRGRKLYIAGPMTGHKDFNLPAFDACAEMYRALGWDVINPADHARREGPGHSWSHYMRIAIKAIVDCDAVVMLDGWANSRGAMLEYAIARELRLEFLPHAEILRELANANVSRVA